MSREPRGLGLVEELGHAAAQRAVLLDQHVGQPRSAALLGPLLPGVELLAGLRGAAGHDDGTDVVLLEDAETGALEELRALDQLVTEAGVGLVGAVPRHRVGVGQPRHRRRHVHPDEAPQSHRDLLAEREDVVLLDEAHLDVQLGELGLPVGPEVLVPVTARDLVVPLHPRHHEQLLEQLRALGQRIPGPRRQPGRDDEVARALGRRARHRRGLDLDEVVRVQDRPRGGVHARPQPDRRPGRGTAQVEVPVLEARLLADVDALVDLERQRRARVQDVDGRRDDLDLTRSAGRRSRCPPAAGGPRR